MSQDDDPVCCALRNELILQQVFKFLPLESLLIASQLNKFWLAESRTYIRDHRNVFSKLNLRHLTVLGCEEVVNCPVTSLVFRLVTEKSDKMTNLSLTEISTELVTKLATQEKMEFPRLQELELGGLSMWLPPQHANSLKNSCKRFWTGLQP